MRWKVIPWVRCTPMWGLLWIWLYVRDINRFITSLSQCLQPQDQLNEIYQPVLVHSTSAQRDTIGERRSCWALASSSGSRGCLPGAPRPVPGRDAREESRGPGGLLGRSPWCCSRLPRCLLREGRIPFPGARPAVPLTPPFGCKGCTATSRPLAAPLLLLSPVSTERAGLLCLRGGSCPPRTPWAWGGCFNFGRTCPPPFPDKLGPAPAGTAFWGWWAPGCLRGCPGKSRGCPTARGGEGAAGGGRGGGGGGGRCCQESSSGGLFPSEETGQGGSGGGETAAGTGGWHLAPCAPRWAALRFPSW